MAVAFAFAIVSCAQFERQENNGKEESMTPIVFESPIVNPATKAEFTTNRKVLYGTTYPINWRFVVAAVRYDDVQTFATLGWDGTGVASYFAPTEMRYQEFAGKRGWSSEYVWPSTGKLAFQAYSPVVNNDTYNGATIGAEGVRFTNYTIASDGSQSDLMYSNRAVNQTKSNFDLPNSTYTGVQLSFKHALSSVVFNAKTPADLSTTRVKITEISLRNVVMKGSFRQNLISTSTDNDAAHVATWTLSTNAADKSSYANIIPEGGIELSNDQIPLWEIDEVKDLLVLPQNFSDAEFRVSFSIENKASGSTTTQTYSVPLSSLQFRTSPNPDSAPIPSYNSFEMGKKYVFTLEVGLQRIRFQPYIEPWGGVIVL